MQPPTHTTRTSLVTRPVGTFTAPTPRFAFIHACWHADIVHRARDAFVDHMEQQGIRRDRIDEIEVPGAFEIPLMAKKLAQSGHYAAVVGCAFVVDGGIYRHEFVAATVVDALMAVQLETGIPVLSVVLTPHHFHASDEHQQFFGAHFVVKGTEAASACLRTVQALQGVEEMLASHALPAIPAALPG